MDMDTKGYKSTLPDNLFRLNEAEKKMAIEFMDEHKAEHGRECTGFQVIFDWSSGIGVSAIIVCKKCGEAKDITDYSAW